jgi:ADP-heptose:LPS heptosyltransferase
MLDFSHKTILISRTDSIGDVCLTLPLCGYLKQRFEGIRIVFLGNTYTAPVLACCPDIDMVLSWKELSSLPENEQVHQLTSLSLFAAIHVFPNKEVARLVKKCGVPNRIGTSHRLFHWLTCSHRVDFTRKNAEEHESQLNFHLLKPTGLNKLPTLEEVQTYVHFSTEQTVPDWLAETLNTHQPKVILHPKSQGSAVEWGVNRFAELGQALLDAGYALYYTGTEKEAESFRHLIPQDCIDTTGKLSLSELIALIQHADALVAASTGPLHIEGLLGKRAVGLFAPRRPIHPGRWRPLGANSTTLVFDENCTICSTGKPCRCIEKISVHRVMDALQPNPHRHS